MIAINKEMPINCETCIYSDWSNFYQIYTCNAARKREPIIFDEKQVSSTAIVRSRRADNCPLIAIPPVDEKERNIDIINLDKGDFKNLKTIFDLFWPEMIADYANDGELDNIEYLRSLIRINDWLEHEVNNEESYSS